MKTIVKTTVKGHESLTVKDTVEKIYEKLTDKHSFILLTALSHDNKESQVGIRKTSIKMFK